MILFSNWYTYFWHTLLAPFLHGNQILALLDRAHLGQFLVHLTPKRSKQLSLRGQVGAYRPLTFASSGLAAANAACKSSQAFFELSTISPRIAEYLSSTAKSDFS